MEDDSEAKALLKVCSIIFVSLSYCYFIVSKIPKGKMRLLFILPILVLYTILPLSLSYVFTTGITSSFITWLTSSKLLLYSFGLGPLTTAITGRESDVRNLTHIKSFLTFVLMAAFPIKIKDSTTSYSKKSSKVLPLNLWSKALISSILIAICDKYGEKLQVGVVLVIYSGLLCCLVDIAMGLSNMLVGPMMGLELVEPSNEPYLATSLQDFWGRRWNLMVTHTLRHTVYNPTRVFSSKYLGGKWATALGTMAAFSVSGLMHELIFYYVTRVSPSWEVTWFFVLQGISVTIEVALKRAMGDKLRLHWAVTNPLTVGFVMGTGYLWFFPPLVRNKVDLRSIQELQSLYEAFISFFKWVR
ncbi:long-chain-alcohol O-fatty-acyltransferase-like [Silene latifolia]|uniref:long-chain-alcohol O-fatty-acyltransferase-like n=1 Tax=Silene latifolia TaxID=37657 RepID=UPI003D789004